MDRPEHIPDKEYVIGERWIWSSEPWDGSYVYLSTGGDYATIDISDAADELDPGSPAVRDDEHRKA